MRKKSFYLYWALFILVDLFFVLSWIGISAPVEHQIGTCHVRFSKTLMPAWLKCRIKKECESPAQKEALIEKNKMMTCLCQDQEKEAEMIKKYYQNELQGKEEEPSEICKHFGKAYLDY